MKKTGTTFSIPITRRDFMKLAAVSAATLAAGGANPPKANAALPSAVDFSTAEIPTLFETDVCVVGGGAAGTAAAVSAARNGARTLLIERSIVLGGLATLGCVYPCMPTFIDGSDTSYITELNQRMEQRQGARARNDVVTDFFYGGGQGLYAAESLTLVYEELCAEAGADILYETTLVGAVVEQGSITECIVQTVEGLGKIRAKTFIDATGDALLSRLAGVRTEKGSEQTGRNQPMSLRFEMAGVDVNKVCDFFTDTLKDQRMEPPLLKRLKEDVAAGKAPFMEFAKIKENEAFFQQGVKEGKLTEDDILYIQGFSVTGKPDTMAMNCPEMPPLLFSATDAASRSKAIMFGRRMMHRIAAFLVSDVPGFEKAYISREAGMLGTRETWRIRGKYYLIAEDYWGGHHFPDAVCRTAYPIDIHDVKLNFGKKLKKGEYYEIPYRALVPEEISNLIVAGRCISGSFAAQASFRIQPTCMSMGEAAGIAAAWGLLHGMAANDVRWEDIPQDKRSYVSKG